MKSPTLPENCVVGVVPRKKLLLCTKTPRKELQGDEFFFSELGPWEPLWIEKRQTKKIKGSGNRSKTWRGHEKGGWGTKKGKGREMV